MDWMPPRTADMACQVMRATLFKGCWAVRTEPAVWTWTRSIMAFGTVAPYRSFMMRAHSRRAARNLATSEKKSRPAVKIQLMPGAKSSTF